MPAQAQESAGSSDARVAEMLLRARDAYDTDSARRRCDRAAAGQEIVVCAQDDARFRVPSTSQSDPLSPEALDDGRLHAPDLEPKYPGPVVARGCFIPPCPRPPAYMIDLSTIPEAPPGSDADKIARGEMRAP
ncbi:hypothetical protein [Novosphingobium album (ex Liu et al. 2023)]|nr:hypothetical protein [Novosphingobium album (ex Liu et al. 2023)]